MKKLYIAAISTLVALTVVAVALAWNKDVSPVVTATPVCNTQTGEFEGEFTVTWATSGQNEWIDGKYWVFQGTAPASGYQTSYSASADGSTVSETFTFTWERLLGNKLFTETKTKSLTLPQLGECEKEVVVPPVTPEDPHKCTPQNPDGSLGGKDGKPGNDDCAADPVPPVTTPEPPVTPPVEPPVVPPVTPPVTPEPPVVVEVPETPEQPVPPVVEEPTPTTPPVSEPTPDQPVAEPTTEPQAAPETA